MSDAIMTVLWVLILNRWLDSGPKDAAYEGNRDK